eukprot:561060-Amphidinium_carterae.1
MTHSSTLGTDSGWTNSCAGIPMAQGSCSGEVVSHMHCFRKPEQSITAYQRFKKVRATRVGLAIAGSNEINIPSVVVVHECQQPMGESLDALSASRIAISAQVWQRSFGWSSGGLCLPREL